MTFDLPGTKPLSASLIGIVRECGGNSVPSAPNAPSRFIRQRPDCAGVGRVVHFRRSCVFGQPHERFEIKGIGHQEADSRDGACAHMAERSFSRHRRAAIGICRHFAGAYLLH